MRLFMTLFIAAVLVVTQGPVVAHAQGFLDVQSDNLSIDNKTSSAVFTGNVVVERDGVVMTADHVKVLYKDPADDEEGQRRDDVEQVEATGNVKIVDGQRTITATKALYDVPEDNMTLTGDVIVTEGRENTIRGTKMLYDISQGLITISADAGRVKAKLVPSK